MKDNCLDIGTIQAFLDGELSHAHSAEVSKHMAICDGCAFAFSEAEDEAAIVFPALERELNTLVPTQRLWSKINDSIAVERAGQPFREKVRAFVRMALINPSIAVAASLVIVIGILAAFWVNQNQPAPIDVPRIAASTTAAVQQIPAPTPSATVIDEEPAADNPSRIERVNYRSEPRRASIAPVKASVTYAVDRSAGEQSYVNTISTLSSTIEDKKDGILRPSQRVAFERDMAVVNDTIAKMQEEVKRNPKNETARQVLYSSYQNKIDLLNSVAQREELMASIK